MIQKELFLFIKAQGSSDTANSPAMNLHLRASRLERGRERHIDVIHSWQLLQAASMLT